METGNNLNTQLLVSEPATAAEEGTTAVHETASQEEPNGCAWVVGCLGCLLIPLAIVSLALNIWNIVICANVLTQGLTDDCLHSNFKAFVIGSIVCSAITLLGCGFTVPVPHLVFVILGQIWRSNASTLCSASSPALLLSSVDKSLAVLYFTIAFNIYVIPFKCIARFLEVVKKINGGQ